MKTNRKTLSDPSSKMLVHEQIVDIKRERRALENSLRSLTAARSTINNASSIQYRRIENRQPSPANA
ncbi:hypothetical protein CXB51_017712 [Gossypium anomalum]|uniref:Uncharacterized protein n=1 Tax=Gossypium anomalum TaxID=47600 RepID=A0A8J5YVB6_9ROSI|nr:hypothetical protein CXB51_017712 [Gossypium anomalum]